MPPRLPKELEDVLNGSVDEAFLLYDEVVKLAEAQAGAEPGKHEIRISKFETNPNVKRERNGRLPATEENPKPRRPRLTRF